MKKDADLRATLVPSKVLRARMEHDGRKETANPFLIPVLLYIGHGREGLPNSGIPRWYPVDSSLPRLQEISSGRPVATRESTNPLCRWPGTFHALPTMMGVLLASAFVVSSMSVVGQGGYHYSSCVVSAALVRFEWRPGRQ